MKGYSGIWGEGGRWGVIDILKVFVGCSLVRVEILYGTVGFVIR